MNALDHHALATLFAAYAAFEFLVRRLLPAYIRLPRTDVPRAAMMASVHFLILTLITAGILSAALIVGYAALAALTLVYEVLDARRNIQHSPRALEWFLAKQLVSGIVLIVVWIIGHPFTPLSWYGKWEAVVLSATGVSASTFHDQRIAILTILAAYLFVIDGGTRIVRGIFQKFPTLYANVVLKLSKPAKGESEENVGEWIGILERLITLTFVLTGSFTALAFALTAKSIARFKELEDKEFSEYYLLGTSASLLVAMAAGMLVRIVLKI
ncbi:MAG TPA: hypothetical protein VNL69_02325 [Bacteroidota bacterium]|nr:hypothetical protein [Bacteroidota bacterium]